MLGGCGILLAVLGAFFFWSKHDKSKGPVEDGWGCAAAFLFGWTIVSVIAIALVLMSN